MCLSANYRVALEFTPASLLASLRRLIRLVRTVTALRAQVPQSDWMRAAREMAYSRGASFRYQRMKLESGLGAAGLELLAAFDHALSGDLMTPQCLPVLDQVLQHVQLSHEEKLRIVASMDLVLGLQLMDLSAGELNLRPASATLTAEEVSAVVEERERARQVRDFAKADELRRRLSAEGVALMDSEASGTWEWVPQLQDR
jgi:cysteinyl-tRNA synthetase